MSKIPSDGRKWPQRQCAIKLDGPALDARWRDVVLDAMSMWNKAGARFQFKEDSASRNHVAAYPQGRWNGWLAVTKLRPRTPNSSLTYMHVLLNLYYEWEPSHPDEPPVSSRGAIDLRTIMAHELGHALRLGDDLTSNSRSIMKAIIRPGEHRSLSKDDIAAIKALYR